MQLFTAYGISNVINDLSGRHAEHFRYGSSRFQRSVPTVHWHATWQNEISSGFHLTCRLLPTLQVSILA